MKKIIFLILFILSFILSLAFNYSKIDVPIFGGLYKSVWVDVIYKENKDLKLININNYSLNVLKIDENHYLYKPLNYKKIKEINISNSEKIKQIIVYVDKKVQYDNFNNIDNSKNILDRTAIIILSFFYNFELYLFSYLFLFLFLYNFKGKINAKICFWIFIALSFILRLAQLNNVPFWDDEIYVLRVTENYSPLSALFNDPGNPPLYFILFKIYRTIVQNPLFYRLLGVVPGSIFSYIFYFYLKRFIGKAPAFAGLFFATFNMALIFFSQELRCYMLLMLLAVILSYYLFNYKRYPYLISAVAILHLHFYGIFYLFCNFLFGIFYLKKKKRIDFIIVNMVAVFLFLPCLIYKIITLPEYFNSWISITPMVHYIQIIGTFCSNILILIIFAGILSFTYKKTGKRKKIFIRYNLFLIISMLITVSIFTFTVKPILTCRYFYIVYPCYLALCATFTRKIILNIVIFLFLISRAVLIQQNVFCNHNLYIDFIKHDIDKTKENYVFMTDTVEYYREFLFDNIKPIYVMINTGINKVNPLKYGVKKDSNCYVLNLYMEDEVFDEAKNIELYKSPLGVFTKLEY